MQQCNLELKHSTKQCEAILSSCVRFNGRNPTVNLFYRGEEKPYSMELVCCATPLLLVAQGVANLTRFFEGENPNHKEMATFLSGFPALVEDLDFANNKHLRSIAADASLTRILGAAQEMIISFAGQTLDFFAKDAKK